MFRSEPEKILSKLNKRKKVNFKVILEKEDYLDSYIPERSLHPHIRALVYHDFDLQTTQYWGSCGTAATITQLRHLSPTRPARLATFIQSGQAPEDPRTKDLFIHEYPPNHLGLKNDLIMDGGGGFLKIDQAWLYAETRNSKSRLRAILKQNKGRKLSFSDIENIRSVSQLEDGILQILGRNHLAEFLIDGAFNHHEVYPFPKTFEEWEYRDQFTEKRPMPKPTGGPFEELEKWIEDICNENKPRDMGEEGFNHDHPCDKLKHHLDELKTFYGPVPHVVVITGVYETTPSGAFNNDESGYLLFRVLDSNPTGDYTQRIEKESYRSTKPQVRYMTARELFNHTRHLRNTYLREWSTGGDHRICGANVVRPWTHGWD